MGAEEVALGLEQVGGQALAAVAVVVLQACGHAGSGNSVLHRHAKHVAPALLSLGEFAGEVGIEQDVGDGGVLVERLLDLAEEHAADDAAAPPHQGDAAVVQVPSVLLRGSAHQGIPLRIGNYLRGEEGLAEILQERGTVPGVLRGFRAFEYLGCGHTLLLLCGEAAGEDGLADQCQRHSLVEGGDGGPFAGALLAGGVEDVVQHVAAVLILLREDVAGDLHEVAVEVALVPLGEGRVHLLIAHAEDILHYMVAFADKLDVAVLDAVVHHLHEVAGTAFSHPVAAGGATFHVGADALEDGLDVRPCCGGSAGHHRGTLEGAFLAAGDSGADVKQALALDVCGAACGVREVGVAAVDDDVPGVEHRDEFLDEIIHGLAGLHHQEHPAGSLERTDEIFQRMGSVDVLALSAAFHELVHLLYGAVENADAEALAFHVQHEVLAHHGETYKSYI